MYYFIINAYVEFTSETRFDDVTQKDSFNVKL